MKTTTYYTTFFMIFSLLFIPFAVWAAEQPVPADAAAVVNGSIITEEALSFETQRFMEQMARQGQVPNEAMMPQMRENVFKSNDRRGTPLSR